MLLKKGLNIFQFLIICQLSHYLRAISTLAKEVLIPPSHPSFLFLLDCDMDLRQYFGAWSFLILKLFFFFLSFLSPSYYVAQNTPNNNLLNLVLLDSHEKLQVCTFFQ